MSSRFAESVIKELNKFRNNPKSIQHQCEVIRKGFSRIKAGDPFLNEIDYFVKELDSMKELPELELNSVLTEAAKKERKGEKPIKNRFKYFLKMLEDDAFQPAAYKEV